MDDHELEALLSDLESDRIERKSSASDREKVRQAVCAFANDLPGHKKPGVVFIGIHDDGRCAGLAVTDKLLRDLGDMRMHMTPFPMLVVQKRILGGCEVAVVVVHPSDSPPVRLDGRAWVRVGPRRAVATQEEERRLAERRRWRDLPFDLQPVPSAAPEDLDLDLFERTYLPSAIAADVLERNHRTSWDKLTSLRFATVDRVPTTLGILTLGKDPRRFIPSSYVQFLRIDGITLTEPVQDEKELDGALPDLLRRLDEILLVHVRSAVEFREHAREVRHPDYPVVALQQIVRNAVLHRTYDGTNAPIRFTWFSDRIEVQSPGGPFGQVTVENFGEPGVTDYRNPHLAEVMKNLGYIQRFGVGIQLARDELRKNGNPGLEFDVTSGASVLATIRARGLVQ